jgi:hypothetical protein
MCNKLWHFPSSVMGDPGNWVMVARHHFDKNILQVRLAYLDVVRVQAGFAHRGQVDFDLQRIMCRKLHDAAGDTRAWSASAEGSSASTLKRNTLPDAALSKFTGAGPAPPPGRILEHGNAATQGLGLLQVVGRQQARYGPVD